MLQADRERRSLREANLATVVPVEKPRWWVRLVRCGS